MPAKKSVRKLSWIAFLKKWAKDHKIDYGEAMKSEKARKAYHNQ